MTTKNKSLFVLASFILMMFLSVSCKKTTPPNPNEEELITTFVLLLKDSAGVAPDITAIYRDLDGDGGNNPSRWDTITMLPSTTYFAEIFCLDETKSPADSISHEIKEEAKEHLFCFLPSGVNVAIQRTDNDGQGYELGLLSTWRTGAISNGNIRIQLRHQPGTKNGTCDPGSTDLDITFPARIF